MWDFEHPPRGQELAARYEVSYMLPAECADRLADGSAEIGLVPIATLARNPALRILPGCTIASKKEVRSLLLVRRASQPLSQVRSVAADTASRTTVIYARLLFHAWGNAEVPFLPMRAELDSMLDHADAAILIGDPALLALEERANREERTGEVLVYHDLAAEWQALAGLPFVSAVWGAAPAPKNGPDFLTAQVVEDFAQSRDRGLANIEQIVAEWTRRIPLSEYAIRAYLTRNIHYVLDEDCLAGMRGFFRKAAECGALPAYDFERAIPPSLSLPSR